MTEPFFLFVLVLALIATIGIVSVVGAISIVRWNDRRRRALPGGANQMDLQIGPLTSQQLKGLYYEVLQAIDSKGYATWQDVQTGVARARGAYPLMRD